MSWPESDALHVVRRRRSLRREQGKVASSPVSGEMKRCHRQSQQRKVSQQFVFLWTKPFSCPGGVSSPVCSHVERRTRGELFRVRRTLSRPKRRVGTTVKETSRKKRSDNRVAARREKSIRELRNSSEGDVHRQFARDTWRFFRHPRNMGM